MMENKKEVESMCLTFAVEEENGTVFDLKPNG